MTHSTSKPNAEEKTRLDILSKLPCMCCVVLGKGQPSRTEIHHLVDKGTRELSGGHMATIPLCSWHHRGSPSRGRGAQEMYRLYGPSLDRQKKEFVERFGNERALLDRINTLLVELMAEDVE